MVSPNSGLVRTCGSDGRSVSCAAELQQILSCTSPRPECRGEMAPEELTSTIADDSVDLLPHALAWLARIS